MNLFYRFCINVTKRYQNSIQKEIDEHTRTFNHARYCRDICYKAWCIAREYKGLNAPRPHASFTPEEIDILIQFVNLKEVGTRVDYEKTEKECIKWFEKNGLPIPEKNY